MTGPQKKDRGTCEDCGERPATIGKLCNCCYKRQFYHKNKGRRKQRRQAPQQAPVKKISPIVVRLEFTNDELAELLKAVFSSYMEEFAQE